ncbi:MAG: methyltransferase domain-containing protein [Balneolaceae bacterium]
MPFLKNRAEHLVERMDRPDCDKEVLFNTYRQFSHVNDLISRWESLFKAYIAPLGNRRREMNLLDIGCGGGDLCLKFADWANEAGIRMQITGIDPDPRAMEYVKQLDVPENVEFKLARASDLVRYGERYDVVVSNHLLHHLRETEILELCKQTEQLTRQLAIFNDLRRSTLAMTAFGMTAPFLYRSSFIVRDGFTSIRRSFTKPELKKVLPEGWVIKKLFPYRLLVMYEPG